MLVHQKLTGVFEVRIYPIQYQVRKLLADAEATEDSNPANLSQLVSGVDLFKLKTALSSLDAESTCQRRLLYNRLYHEARLSLERGKGISFTNMLLMLAHNKLINDKEALR